MARDIRIALISDIHIDHDVELLHTALWADGIGNVYHPAVAFRDRLRARSSAHPDHPSIGPDLHAAVGADLVVVAGDVATEGTGTAYLKCMSEYCGAPVVAVPGNHDLYGADIGTATERLMTSEWESGVWLHNTRADMTIDGRSVAILGTTLWSDFQLGSDRPTAMDIAGRNMTDHRMITTDGGVRPFTPTDALVLHHESRMWPTQSLRTAKSESDLVVVVTHHAPIPEALSPEKRHGPLAPSYASDMREYVATCGADLWVSGHSHHDHDRMVGTTRCVSRQRGYVGDRETDAVPMVVVIGG